MLPITSPEPEAPLFETVENACNGHERTVMPRTPFILVFCGRHRYCFVYAKGREEELISTMIRYAMDDRFNFGWAELRSITTHVQTQETSSPDNKPSPQ